MEPNEQPSGGEYPVRFSVDYPDRDLNRLTTAFRLILAIPILVLAAILGGGGWGGYGHAPGAGVAVGAAGLLFLPPLLMIVFRQKYPRWWYDWNLELLRFSNRIGVYVALMDGRYPSTDERQAVSLDFPYPDAKEGLNRWLPLVKWLLAIPHGAAPSPLQALHTLHTCMVIPGKRVVTGKRGMGALHTGVAYEERRPRRERTCPTLTPIRTAIPRP